MKIPSIFLLLLPLAAVTVAGSGQDWNSYAEAWLAGEPYFFSGEPYYGEGGPYFQEIASGFAEPFFYPESNLSEATYYPYFGEDFFIYGYDPREVGQQAIEAQRQKFENPYYHLFGDSFFGRGEPYQPYQKKYPRLPDAIL